MTESIHDIVKEWDIDELRSMLDDDKYGSIYNIGEYGRSVLHAVFERIIANDSSIIDINTLSDEEMARGIGVLNYLIGKLGGNVDKIINRPDCEGNTPLHYLVEYFGDNGIEFAKILIANGARADIKNNDDQPYGLTAVDTADINGHKEIKEYLATNIKGNIAPDSNVKSPRADSLDHHKKNQIII